MFCIILNNISVCFGDSIQIDYYLGEFHPSNSIIVPDGELFNITFEMNPIESISNVEVHFLLPQGLVEFEKGDSLWVGDLEKDSQ
mgnify:FL=1